MVVNLVLAGATILDCPVGSGYQDGSALCTLCKPGRYGTGNGTCTLCTAGRFSSAVCAKEESACQLCPPGTYSNQAGSSHCLTTHEFQGSGMSFVTMSFEGVNFSSLTATERQSLTSSYAATLASAAHVGTESVRDAVGRSGSVTLVGPRSAEATVILSSSTSSSTEDLIKAISVPQFLLAMKAIGGGILRSQPTTVTVRAAPLGQPSQSQSAGSTGDATTTPRIPAEAWEPAMEEEVLPAASPTARGTQSNITGADMGADMNVVQMTDEEAPAHQFGAIEAYHDAHWWLLSILVFVSILATYVACDSYEEERKRFFARFGHGKSSEGFDDDSESGHSSQEERHN